MVEAGLFVSLIIVAITQMIKMAAPAVVGWVTIAVAFVVAILIALVDNLIGVTDISIAEGIVYALGAVGISAVAGKAGGGSPGDGRVIVNR